MGKPGMLTYEHRRTLIQIYDEVFKDQYPYVQLNMFPDENGDVNISIKKEDKREVLTVDRNGALLHKKKKRS